MSRYRLTNKEVSDLFAKYGYKVSDNFKHKNVKTKYRVYDEYNNRYDDLSVVQLRYQINYAPIKRPLAVDQFQIYNVLPVNSNNNDDEQPRDSMSRWLSKHKSLDNVTPDAKQLAYNTFKTSIQALTQRNARRASNDVARKPFTIDFTHTNKQAVLYGLIEALKQYDYTKNKIILSLLTSSGNESYVHVNSNTLAYLTDIFNARQDFTDSDAYAINTIDDLIQITVEVRKTNNNNRHAGYFPYINTSDIDLTMYGIYNSEEQLLTKGNESCLVTAMRSVLDEDELMLLKSMVKTRYVLRASLKHIAKTFNLDIEVRVVNDYDSGKTSHASKYTTPHIDANTRKVKLLIAYEHYFINKTLMYEDRMLSIISVIKRLMAKGQLVPLTKACIKQLIIKWQTTNSADVKCKQDTRPVYIKNRHKNAYQRDHNVKQTKSFFGYECPSDLIDKRLRELQAVINKLPLRHPIDVSSYYKFSDLAQSIAYEYGVYDDVYELTGNKAATIRSSLKFPQTKVIQGEHFYYNSKEHDGKPLYYLDMNAAYMAFANSIPTGPDGNGTPNTKLGELMKKLYNIRRKNKQKYPELCVTLKFIMNSFYGYSIRRSPVIKTKYRQNPEAYAERFDKFVIKTQGNYVSTVQSYCEHYSVPHLASSILTQFNAHLDKLMSLVNVYYVNVDAILTDEDGYNKLKELGYVGEGLGQLKIEKMFNEIAIISSRRYAATTIDNQQILHCIKNLNYDDVVRIAKSK